MTRRRKWILAAAVLALPAAAVTAYFVWGALLEAEYERRVDALRRTGDYIDEPETWDAGVPAETNAAALLREAAALLERLKKEDGEFADLLHMFVVYDGACADEEALKELRQVWPRLDGYFAKLEDACARPVFAPPPLARNPDGQPPWCGIQDHAEMWTLWSKLDPDHAPRIVQQILDLAERFRPADAIATTSRGILRWEALRILHGGLAKGTLDVGPYRVRWDRQLAAVDSFGDLALRLRLERIEAIRLFETFRRGEDPLADTRNTMQEVRDLIADLAQDNEKIDVPDFFPHVPDTTWLATWYGRPMMHRLALEGLDAADRAVQRDWDEVSLREAAAESHVYASDLADLAILRLARLAMRIREDAESRGAVRDRLQGYGTVGDGSLPVDPFTGEAFVYEKHADRVVLSSAILEPTPRLRASFAKRVIAGLADEDLLRWEVRWGD